VIKRRKEEETVIKMGRGRQGDKNEERSRERKDERIIKKERRKENDKGRVRRRK